MKYEDELMLHYGRVWGEPLCLLWPRTGRSSELSGEFCVAVYRRRSGTFVYATCGMAKCGGPVELHCLSKRRHDEDILTALAAVAVYQNEGYMIQEGASVNLGVPIVPGSHCDFALISLPYLDGPSLESFVQAGEVVVRCLWLIPITKAEREYKKAHGLEQLESLFERSSIDYANLRRRSLI